MNPVRALATSRDLCSEIWPSARNSLCARRAEIPEILQFIRGIFPEHLRDLDAARLLFQICTYGGAVRELESNHMGCTAYAGREKRILCAWRAEIPKVLQFFREVFAQFLHDLDVRRALFRI